MRNFSDCGLLHLLLLPVAAPAAGSESTLPDFVTTGPTSSDLRVGLTLAFLDFWAASSCGWRVEPDVSDILVLCSTNLLVFDGFFIIRILQ